MKQWVFLTISALAGLGSVFSKSAPEESTLCVSQELVLGQPGVNQTKYTIWLAVRNTSQKTVRLLSADVPVICAEVAHLPTEIRPHEEIAVSVTLLSDGFGGVPITLFTPEFSQTHFLEVKPANVLRTVDQAFSEGTPTLAPNI